MIVIVDTVEPTPTADGANVTGLTTNLFAISLYLNINSWILFGEIFNLMSLPATIRCWSSAIRVAWVFIALANDVLSGINPPNLILQSFKYFISSDFSSGL